MSNLLRRAKRRIGHYWNYRYLPLYWWFHKYKFGVKNTKFDISWCVFLESFIQDQYDIRRFLDSIKQANNLFFIDIGRNHGFVFFYTMYHIMRSNFDTSTIKYIGIDPSPLKFVYFNYFKFLRQADIDIDYHLLDKAVVFNDASHAKLKYGEKNFGNFNISGSNYAQKLARRQNQFSYVDITVETISVKEIKEIIAEHKSSDAMMIKIDCKNQTTRLFMETLDILNDYDKPYLVACEKDSSIETDLSSYSKPGFNVLTASNAFKKTS